MKILFTTMIAIMLSAPTFAADISGKVGVASDNIFRGVNMSDGFGYSAQGNLSLDNGIFAGASVMSLNENSDLMTTMLVGYGFDLGGAGPCVRTAMSCVGAGRCEMSNINEHKAHRLLVNNFIDDMHRPALPYKFKFKVSGCANDCMNSIERADMSIIGTWRDDIKIDQAEFKAYVDLKGRKYVIDNIVTRCPTNAISLNDDDSVTIDNQNCVKCMHCLNVVPKAFHPGDDKGATVLMGGKRTLKIGDLMGTVIVPFMKLESQEDWDKLVEIAEESIDFWADNALEHERCGEMIERIGLVNFLEGIGIEVDPNMVGNPRESSYFRGDGWDGEAVKWYERADAKDKDTA